MFKKIKNWYNAKKEAKKYVDDSAVDQKKSKDEATSKKEPYVAVLNTHVNPENVRNGFFELDWNEYFVVQLKEAGYAGTTEEEIVDQWFQDLCKNIGADEGINMDRRGSGYVNVNNLGNGKSEVS